MEKVWRKPETQVQWFVPNEYVAACVTGQIVCAIPGHSPYECNDGTTTRNFGFYPWQWDGPKINSDGLDHGLCGTSATISFSDTDGSGSGFEVVNGSIDYDRPIWNINGYELSPGDYPVTWNSTDGANKYNHYGILHITATGNNANHS